jgi:uncharacterized membrane protein YbhN (UPF0104 family)
VTPIRRWLTRAAGLVTPRTRRWLMRAALLVALVLLVLALRHEWHKVSSSAQRLSIGAIVESFVLGMVGLGGTALAWRALLVGFGASLPVRSAIRVFFIGQLGKYLPGSVWPVVAQMEMSRDLGVGRTQAGAASLVTLALAAPSAVLTSALTLPFVSAAALSHYWPVLLVLPVSAVLLHPPILNRMLNWALRVARRGELPRPVPRTPLLLALAWMVFSYVAFGASIWALAHDLGATGSVARQLLVSIGGFGLAWAAGFLVVFVPAGAGIREAVLTLTLSPVLPHGPAILVALVSRLVFTGGDLAWAGIGALLRPRQVAASAAGAVGEADGPDGADPTAAAVARNDNSSTTQPLRGTGSAAS